MRAAGGYQLLLGGCRPPDSRLRLCAEMPMCQTHPRCTFTQATAAAAAAAAGCRRDNGDNGANGDHRTGPTGTTGTTVRRQWGTTVRAVIPPKTQKTLKKNKNSENTENTENAENTEIYYLAVNVFV